jgi:serine/threonine-protein kinase
MAFVGENIKEVLDRVLSEDPCPISVLRPDVPPALIEIVARALVRDRDQRWPTAALFARALAPFGSIGVLSGLSSIQLEVGALSSVPSLRTETPYASMGSFVPHPPASVLPSPSVEPMVAPLSRQTYPDPNELSRRHFIVQDWAALQTRRRKARGVLLAMATVLLCASAIAILLYRFGRPRVSPSGPVVAAVASGGEPAPVTAVPAPETSVVPAPTLAPSSSSAAKNVYAAPGAVQSASKAGRKPRHPAPKSPRRAP